MVPIRSEIATACLSGQLRKNVVMGNHWVMS
jgi:hypothetical protein